MDGSPRLPWRGPGPGRPDLPLPPAPMPLWAHGAPRKRWRYVAVFAAETMLCAARVQIGPFGQTFWVLWDRDGRRRHAHTSLRPGSREVAMEDERVAIEAGGVRAELRLDGGGVAPVESICPSGRGWGWTRKRAGLPTVGTVEAEGRRWEVEGLAVDDESAGYHRRSTSWLWSAGVGRARDGRSLAWNLVEGINDPPRNSERAIWVDGEPFEPGPVSFAGLDAIGFGEGGELRFDGECERTRTDNLLLVRSRYRLRFGTFSGSLAGTQLTEGLGVMEQHDARW